MTRHYIKRIFEGLLYVLHVSLLVQFARFSMHGQNLADGTFVGRFWLRVSGDQFSYHGALSFIGLASAVLIGALLTTSEVFVPLTEARFADADIDIRSDFENPYEVSGITILDAVLVGIGAEISLFLFAALWTGPFCFILKFIYRVPAKDIFAFFAYWSGAFGVSISLLLGITMIGNLFALDFSRTIQLVVLLAMLPFFIALVFSNFNMFLFQPPRFWAKQLDIAVRKLLALFFGSLVVVAMLGVLLGEGYDMFFQDTT